jgi:hypothetical protein
MDNVLKQKNHADYHKIFICKKGHGISISINYPLTNYPLK